VLEILVFRSLSCCLQVTLNFSEPLFLSPAGDRKSDELQQQEYGYQRDEGESQSGA
jgi:hypothetical protein